METFKMYPAQFVVWSVLSLLTAVGSVCAEDDTVTVFANGTSTNLGAFLAIGDTGTNNLLVISNATTVASSTGSVGNASSAHGNSLLVSGAGTIYTSQVFWVGNTGSFNQATIANGGRLVTGLGTFQSIVGRLSTSSNDSVVVTGMNSLWSINGDLRLGPGRGHTVTISDGGQVNNSGVSILGDLNSVVGDTVSPVGNNTVVVTGSNSVWNAGSSGASFWVGRRNSGNQVIITNGGTVNSFASMIGVEGTGLANNNRVIVTGTNSLWRIGTSLTIRFAGNELQINDGGTVISTNILLGEFATANNDAVSISGGHLFVTNATSTATYEVLRGSNILNSGSITVDKLFLTNGSNSRVLFTSGTLNTKSTAVSNTMLFTVGDGANSATLHVQGGTHVFFNGLHINTNATLMGTGSIVGDTTVQGTLAPGNSPGILSTENLTLLSNATYAVDIDGTTVGTQYDQVDVTGFVSLSNSLLSITLGYTPLKGDSFTIINNDGNDAVLGEFLGIANHSEFQSGGGEFKIFYNGGTGNDVVLIAVPEPSALGLAALAFVGMIAFRRQA